MDPSSKQTKMNELLQKIHASQHNEIQLHKLELEERKKYWDLQRDYTVAKQKADNKKDLQLVNDQINLQHECVNLVLKAVDTIEKKKYFEQLPLADVETASQVTLEKKTEEVQLKFIKYIKSKNVFECDSLTLDCACQGRDNDDLELIWFRNNKQIPKNPDFRHEREGNIFKLIVTAVFPDDSGVFSALLKSKSTNNEQLSSCSIIIQARDREPLDPVFVQFPQSINLEKGEKAKFDCKISGSMPMTAQWNFNGKPLDNNESTRYTFTNGATEFSLEIPGVSATDEGQYALVISNDKGKITAAFTLHVYQSDKMFN